MFCRFSTEPGVFLHMSGFSPGAPASSHSSKNTSDSSIDEGGDTGNKNSDVLLIHMRENRLYQTVQDGGEKVKKKSAERVNEKKKTLNLSREP